MKIKEPAIQSEVEDMMREFATIRRIERIEIGSFST
jgi:hypothetical protein